MMISNLEQIWNGKHLFFNSFAFRCASVIWIGNANASLSVYVLCNSSCATFVTEITTSPICWVGKCSITCKTFPFIIKDNASSLRWLEMGNLIEFRKLSLCNGENEKRSISDIVWNWKILRKSYYNISEASTPLSKL